jgi:hypothetical protein
MEIDFLFTRGDTFSFTFELEDFTGDLDTCYFSCKEDVGDKTYAFQKSLGNGIEKISDKQYRVKLNREDTIDMIVGLPYFHDVEIGINGDFLTIISGKLKLKQDITRNIEGE